MAEPIQIEVEFAGAEQAARAADRVGDGLGDMARGALDAARRTTEAGNQVRELSGRFLSTVAVVQNLGRAFGSESGGLASQVSALAGAVSAIAPMFGPTGALVGGIVGTAVPAILSLADAHTSAADAAREQIAQLRALADQAIATRRAQQQQTDIRRGDVAGIDVSDLERERERRRQAIVRLEREQQSREDRGIIGAETIGRTLTQQRIQQVREEVATIDREISRLRGEVEETASSGRGDPFGTDSALRSAMGRARGSAPGATPERRRGGRGGGGSDADREMAERLRREQEFEDQLLALREARIAAEEEFKAREEELNREKNERIVEQERARMEAEAEAKIEQLDKIEEREEEMARQRAEREREQEDAYRAEVDRYSGVTQTIVSGLTDTFVAMATGQKSAEEAAKEMLAGSLQYISQQSALRAAMEFAEAIASFASQRYDSGALHLAAGAGFTAVAVATGVGAAMLVQPPSGAAKPAEPESKGGGEKGGGDVVINWNSPIVTAGTRAELGRTMAQTIRAGEQRFGRA